MLSVIFMGRSGCGKGTQAHHLKEVLLEKKPGEPVFYLESGDTFRSFIEGNSYSQKLAKSIYEQGLRQPDFLAVWIWGDKFVGNLTGNEHLLIDGTPRSLSEAHILRGALEFYKRNPIHVVYLNVSRGWSERHLRARGRSDDQSEKTIKERLDWFESDVLPAVEYFRTRKDVVFHDIDGERPIEEIAREVREKINF